MKVVTTILLLTISGISMANDTLYQTLNNIPYYGDDVDAYTQKRARLDLYCPNSKPLSPTLVWFHGGALSKGSKKIPEPLKIHGMCVIAVNYRLYPKVKPHQIIEDAAAAVAWVFENIEQYNGDPSLIFVAGHSAGGYLASMIGMDKSWLSHHGIDANAIAGLFLLSAQSITHFIVRQERGIPKTQPIIDQYAPIYHVRADAPPTLLITGDRDLEIMGRYEENAYMMRMMKFAGHKRVKLLELDGYDHSMTKPAFPLIIKEIKRRETRKR